MSRSRLIGFLVFLAAVPLLAWSCDSVRTIRWVGSTDLNVQFVVTNAVNGSPIPNAEVMVYQEPGSFYSDREVRAFTLVTDAGGQVARRCPESMCCGTQSGLKFKDTFAVHLPYWYFKISAKGYETTAVTYLKDLPFHRLTQRDGPRRAKLVVAVALEPK